MEFHPEFDMLNYKMMSKSPRNQWSRKTKTPSVSKSMKNLDEAFKHAREAKYSFFSPQKESRNLQIVKYSSMKSFASDRKNSRSTLSYKYKPRPGTKKSKPINPMSPSTTKSSGEYYQLSDKKISCSFKDFIQSDRSTTKCTLTKQFKKK